MATSATAGITPDVRTAPVSPPHPIDIALLGAGTVGAAVARRIAAGELPGARIVAALVRDPAKPRRAPLPHARLTSDADAMFDPRPDAVIEVLGGVEPAFTLVARALALGIPVVTANKSLLAARGGDLERIAARTGTPLLYEAAVVAGVPFLGALAIRPGTASAITRIEGILNGTSNFILTRMAAGAAFDAATDEARELGLAEPRPVSDISGIDAAEKLAVLVRHIGWGRLPGDGIETSGIDTVDCAQLAAARAFGGVVKPVAIAVRAGGRVAAFSGPAFVPDGHPLAHVVGADNAVVLTTTHGAIVHAGPGAGPDVTAATILDDVAGAVSGRLWGTRGDSEADLTDLTTGWFVGLTAPQDLPPGDEIADFLGAHGIWVHRASTRGGDAHLLTYPTPRSRIERALDSLGAAAGIASACVRALEA